MIPKKVKVGGMEYTVEEKEFVEIDGDKNYLGKVNYVTTQIEVLDNVRKEETFVHELLHAIFFEAGYQEQEEEMIDRVSKVLYQVLKDNQGLLQKCNKSEVIDLCNGDLKEVGRIVVD